MATPSNRSLALPRIGLTASQRRRLADFVHQLVVERMQNALNVFDQPAKAYSPRGPIYIPLTGVKGRSGQRVAARSLGGRYGLNRNQIKRRIDDLEVESFEKGLDEAEVSGSFSRGGRSFKFANYAEFKRFIGHSGQRDLSLSGKMLGSVGLVYEDADSFEIGFTREEEEQKMKGNEKLESSWGLSTEDKEDVLKLFGQMFDENLKANDL